MTEVPPQHGHFARILFEAAVRGARLLAVVAAVAALGACVSTGTNRPGTTLQPYAPVQGNEFAWAQQTIESAGRGNSPDNMTTEPQRSLAGRQAARTAAITKLQREVARLPVTPESTVGTFMNENLGVKRAVQTYAHAAQTVGEREVSPGVFEVRVQTSLAPVAEILRQHGITPTNLPPPPAAQPGVPPEI